LHCQLPPSSAGRGENDLHYAINCTNEDAALSEDGRLPPPLGSLPPQPRSGRQLRGGSAGGSGMPAATALPLEPPRRSWLQEQGDDRRQWDTEQQQHDVLSQQQHSLPSRRRPASQHSSPHRAKGLGFRVCMDPHATAGAAEDAMRPSRMQHEQEQRQESLPGQGGSATQIPGGGGGGAGYQMQDGGFQGAAAAGGLLAAGGAAQPARSWVQLMSPRTASPRRPPLSGRGSLLWQCCMR